MKSRRAAIYARISQDRDGTMLGVDRQIEDAKKLVAARDWTLVETYIDDDVSAYSGKRRPAYRRLLADVESGQVDAVVAWHADRLHRSPRELEEFIDVVEKARATVATVQSGDVDLATASGRAVARTLGAWSRHEVELKAERTSRAHQQAAKQGRYRGGTRPFGFQADGVSHEPVEARELRRLSKAVVAGASLGSLIRDLNDRGILTTTGRPWVYATLRQMLVRPRNAGLSEYKGDIVGPATWKPIVDEATWRAVVALVSNPDRRRSTSNTTKYLLPGIARCGHPTGDEEICGKPMRSAWLTDRSGKRRVIYRCHVYRAQEALDDYVDSLIAARLNRADLADLLAAGDSVGDDLQREEAAGVNVRLDELAVAFADGQVTASQFVTASTRLRERLDELHVKMAVNARGGVLAPVAAAKDPGRAYLALPLDRRRAIIRELVDIVVKPVGRGHVPLEHGVDIEWRTA